MSIFTNSHVNVYLKKFEMQKFKIFPPEKKNYFKSLTLESEFPQSIKIKKDAVVVKGKNWRSIDLANQTNPQNNHPTTTSTNNVTNIHHNSLINAHPTSHYQRHDFKNRRSSSEPANEQKLLAHIQSNSTSTSSATQNTTAITNTSISNISNNQTNNTNNSGLVIGDENASDDFIDCLHQKSIQKVSKILSELIAKHFPSLNWYF